MLLRIYTKTKQVGNSVFSVPKPNVYSGTASKIKNCSSQTPAQACIPSAPSFITSVCYSNVVSVRAIFLGTPLFLLVHPWVNLPSLQYLRKFP